MLPRLLSLITGSTLCVVGLLSVAAQEPKKSEKPEMPGGIEGHVKSVDHDKQSLTIIGSAGRERVFTITEDTTMVGPRGGKVRRRLNDPRFHEGLEIIIHVGQLRSTWLAAKLIVDIPDILANIEKCEYVTSA